MNWQEHGFEPMSRKQQKLLNAACRDLTEIIYHGYQLDQASYRHLLVGVVLGHIIVPSIDLGDGHRSFISLGRSSKELSKSQATDAITMAFMIGDDPRGQGIDHDPIRWSPIVRLARGITDTDDELAERMK
jgi:hypothetical protein